MSVEVPFGSFDEVPFFRYLGLSLEETREDYARVRMNRVETTPTGIGGGMHGGALATLLDMAAVTSVFTGIPENSEPAGTADLQITYLRQAHGDYVEAEATVVKRGRQLCTVHVDIRDDSGRLCSTGRILYALRTA